MINPGETKTVTFTLTPDSLKYYDANMKWTVEPGEFSVFVGGNSQASLSTNFVLK
ncbi:MAG: fibronectin type III-like domain-contianing protein [Bacteroidota bacterium]|nr:fibronectin type III-like domain-contianing protein [Bacteroidota bacterium]